MNTGPASVLNADRRRRDLDTLASGPALDVLVIGGGVTGAGVALDAATRGLRVALVEAHDLAFGTSRWSSKLVHGGLRYLASGNLAVAHESAVERHLLMTITAPHLVRPLATVVPLHPYVGRVQAGVVRSGFMAGDVLRRAAGTPADVLPRSRRISPSQAHRIAGGIREAGLRGGILAYDGQLIDDARLVVTLARTAAAHGAMILTRARAGEVTGTGARITDTLTDQTMTLTARTVISAAGVWSGEIDPAVRLRPSRGTHLVLPAATLGHPLASITVPVEGSTSRFVFAMPEQLDRVYLGLTDEEAPGPIPDVPRATEHEIDHLLRTINRALERPLTRADILGTYSGLRPLLHSEDGSTADVSRKHAVIVGPSGVVTIVGGKLTTYRRMAEDALDRALALTGLSAAPSRTRRLPLMGAPTHPDSRSTSGLPASLVARYGGLAGDVLDSATISDPQSRIAPDLDVTRAEIAYALTHEVALDSADILDRRTRIGLVPADADRARDAVGEILAQLSRR